MEDKSKSPNKNLNLIYISIVLLSVFCFFASLLVFSFCLEASLYFIILIPLVGIFLLTIYYLKLNTPIESLNRLILIDIIIFLFYLIGFLVTFLVLNDPLGNRYFYTYLLQELHFIYFFLLIPLICVILLTIYYIRLNIPIRSRTLSIILVFLALVIILFIVFYLLLNWSVPFLRSYYTNLPDFD